MGFYEVPFVPTPIPVVRRMLQLAEVKEGEVVYDLGAGDGRILFIAVREFKARAVGVEIRRDLYRATKAKIEAEGLQNKIKLYNCSYYDIDLSEADVVTLFLLTSANEKLRPKMERELKKGARVVSHEFEVRGWIPKKVEKFYDGNSHHRIYLYTR